MGGQGQSLGGPAPRELGPRPPKTLRRFSSQGNDPYQYPPSYACGPGHGCGLGVAAGFLSLLSSFLSLLEPPNRRPQKPFFLAFSPSVAEVAVFDEPSTAAPGVAAPAGALDTG